MGNKAPFSTIHEICFVVTICTAQFLAQAGLAQTVAPLSLIGDSFGVHDEGRLSWYPAAFSLTTGTFILPAGRLGDMYGYRNMFIIGFAWYAVWSIVAGVAVYSGDILFTVARGFQGIGPALLVPNALALIGYTYSAGSRKNMIFSLFAAAAPTGWTAGAVLSTAIAQYSWWPWCFWALAITCVFMIIACFAFIPADQPSNTGIDDFDILGCITGISGLVLFNFAWNQAAVEGWKTYLYIVLVVGIIILVTNVMIELRFAKNPIIPLRSMSTEAGLAIVVISAAWSCFGIWVFYLWRFLEVIRGHSPLVACAQNVPVAVSGMLAALSTSFLLNRLKEPQVLLLATVCFMVGPVLLATAPVEQTYWANVFVALVVMPWGMDMSFPSGTILLSNATTQDQQGVAASLVSTAVFYSISIGLGLAGTITKNLNPDGTNTLQAYRGAWYLSIGLDLVAIALALYFVFRYK